MKKISILTLASVMMFGSMVRADVASALSNVNEKVEAVQNACSGIKSNLDSIFGLSVATTVSSSLGTVAASGALATGIIKDVEDKRNIENSASFNSWKETVKDVRDSFGLDKGYKGDYYSNEELLVIAKKTLELAHRAGRKYAELEKILSHKKNIIEKEDMYYSESNPRLLTEKLEYDFQTAEIRNTLAAVLDDLNNIDEETYKMKDSKIVGNVRTGLMAGATATSAVSTGTSIGATLTATKLAEKMAQCNNALRELNIAKGQLEAEGERDEKADEILFVCTGYDESNIKSLKSLATANAVVSGIGTATAGAGTVASVMANSKKVRADKSEKGKKKEKGLNLASNILAGVTMGTSGTSTALSAVQISKAKKDSRMAEECEAVLK